MHEREQEYRPDIDGLRAVAVMAVVLYHAFPQWLPGGYIGVDVFFVISGYLISGQLMASAARGEFSLAEFYGRRIRRILPALIVVLLSAAIAGWFVLLPEEWASLRKHIAASAAFSNNLVLYGEGGYFDGPAALKPLLHLWSLGVEEQFYLVWPLLIAWWWRRGVRWDTIIALTIAVSFAINVMLVSGGGARAAFFLPHARLWQLGAGALLASMRFSRGDAVLDALARWLYRSPQADARVRLKNLASYGGVLLILAACVSLDRGPVEPNWWSAGAYPQVSRVVRWIARVLWLDGSDSAYPGWSALAPTIGAALVIAAGPQARWNRAWLSLKPAVWIGLISYPLYLWHWPILSFLEITEQGAVSRPIKVAAIVLSIVLAAITYVLVERPIRRALRVPAPRRIAPLVGSLAAIGIVMAVSMQSGWLTPPARTAIAIDAAVPIALHDTSCRARFPGLGEYCQQFDPQLPVTVALLGDSHAAHFFPGLGERLQARNQGLVHLGQTGCPPLLDLERLGTTGDHRCVRVNAAIIDAVNADAAITDVWLAFRGAVAVEGSEYRAGAPPAPLFRSTRDGADNAAAIEETLPVTIARLASHGKRVGIVLQIPELDFRIDACTGRPLSLAHRPAKSPCAIPLAAVRERQKRFREIVERIRQQYDVRIFDPMTPLCDDDSCTAMVDGRMLYHDDNHLGQFGSSWVMRGFN